MSKPLDIILTARAQQRDQDAIDQDALQLVDAVGRLADFWTSLFGEAALLTRRRGLTTLLDRIGTLKDPEAATAIQSLLLAAGTFQASVTDLPAPEFPADPVPDGAPA